MDASEYQAAVNEVRGLLHFEVDLDRGYVALREVKRFFDFPLDFFDVEISATFGTDELYARFKRTGRVDRLVTTLRACKVHGAISSPSELSPPSQQSPSAS